MRRFGLDIYGRLLTKPRPCSRPAPAPRCKLGFLAIYSFFSFSCSSFLPVKSLRCCFDLVLSLSLSLLVWMHIRYGSLPTTRKVAEKENFAPEMETSGMCGKNNTNYCPAPFCFAKILGLLFYGTQTPKHTPEKAGRRITSSARGYPTARARSVA